jgi:hypothetical protein
MPAMMGQCLDMCYAIPLAIVTTEVVRTHTVVRTACRGPGHTEAAAFIETVLGIHCLLSTVYCLLSALHCLLSAVFGFLGSLGSVLVLFPHGDAIAYLQMLDVECPLTVCFQRKHR